MSDFELFDQVHFEVADFATAVRLTRRLGHDRMVALLQDEDLNVVTTELRSGPSDLAVLLRQVEAWIEEESLCAIRYLVDDRIYVLEAGGPDWTSHPWTERSETVGESESPQAA
jgi:hypothetical protein